MKRLTPLALGLVLVMGLAASLVPAEAACSAARAIQSSTVTALSGVYTPGNPFTPSAFFPLWPYGGSTTYYINGMFWSLGGGDPTYGIGNDSGSFKGISYFYANYTDTQTWLGGGYYGGFPTFLGGPAGHWQTRGTDGCIDFDGSNPNQFDTEECNIVLLTDEANDIGYFYAMSVFAGTGGDFIYNANTGFPDQLNMAPIPKPTIVTSNRFGSVIYVSAAVYTGTITPQNGFNFHCGDNLVAGYKIYVRTLDGHDTPKPIQIDSRAIDQFLGPPLAPWVEVASGNIGEPVNFQLDCGGVDVDYYLCSTLLFGGVAPGAPFYEMKSCSRNATKIECGPTMADPAEREIERRRERGQAAPERTKRGDGERTGR